MVVLTGVAVGVVVTGGAGAAVAAGIGSATGAGAATAGTGAALGTAVGTSVASGAISGAAATGSLTGAALGAVAGGTAAGGVGSAGIGGGLLAGGIASGPLGWLCVGAKEGTYDCWKPVIHDTSEEPSNGMLLKDLCGHPNVASVSVSPGFEPRLPHIVLENIWQEKFEIEYILLHELNMLVCHAKAL